MAEKESIYGIKYEVDIEELKTSTSEATKQIKLANAEFKKSTSTLEKWGDSTEGIGAKIKQLNSVLEAQKTKLAQTKKTYNDNVDALDSYATELEELRDKKEKAIKQYGKESDEVEKLSKEIAVLERKQSNAKGKIDSLRISILNQETSINKTKMEIEKYDNKLDELTKSETKVASATQKLTATINKQESELQQLKKDYTNIILEQGKGSKEAKELSEKIKQLNASLQQNKTKLNEAESETENLTNELKETKNVSDDASGGFSIMKGAVAGFIANAITTGISKLAEFTTQIFEMSEATKEYRSMTAKLSGSANSFGYSLDWVKEKYKELYGYLADDQMTTNAITNLLGLGLKTQSLDSLVNSAIATWSAYGDSIPIESLTESIAETINVSKVTGTLADTINWASLSNEKWTAILGEGSKAQKAFNATKKEGKPIEDAFSAALSATTDKQERARLVADLLNQTYGQSKQKYDEMAGSITEANRNELELKETQAELGETMQPVNNAISDMKAKALDFVAPAVKKFADKLLELNNALKENPALMRVLTGIAIALATAFGVLAGALMIQGIVTGVTKAISLLNTTMLANPIVLIVALIAGLVAGFIYLWNTSDSFRQFWIDLWNAILQGAESVLRWLVDFFTKTIPEAFENFKNKCMEVAKSVGQFFTDLWNGIVNFFMETIPSWINNALNFFRQLPNYIGYMIGWIIGKFIAFGQSLITFATTKIPEFIENVVTFFSELPNKIWTFLSNAIDKVKTFATDIIQKGIEAGRNFLKNLIDYISKLPDKMWKHFKSGVAKVSSFASDLAKKGLEAGKKLFDNIVDEVKKIPDKMKEIGENIVKGLWNGVNDMIDWVVGKVKGFGKSVLNGIKDALGIHSPSRETYWIGEMMNKGLINAIADGKKAVVNKAKNTAKGVLDAMRNKFKEKVQIGFETVESLKGRTANVVRNLSTGINGNNLAYAGATSNVNNVTFNQYNTSPKSIDSLEVYRNTQKQIRMFQKWKGGK